VPQPPQIDYTYPVIDNSAGPAPADTVAGTQPAAAAGTDETQAPSTNGAAAPAAAVASADSSDVEAAPQAGAGPEDQPDTGSPAAAGGAVAASSGNGLVLQVDTGDSWIGIHDAAGKKLYFNLARKGSRISVQGQLPYEVRIGRAAAVKILYQNKPLDVSAYTHQGVAHFQLTADGPAEP
jgi:cytoskeleton protein RodZ